MSTRFFSWDGDDLMACQWSESTARRLVRISLSSLRMAYLATGWELVSEDDALESLTEEGTVFVFVGDRIVAVNAEAPWFSAETVVYEEFVDEGIPLATVVAVLEAVARRLEVKRILVGTRAAPNQRHAGLAKLYTQEGMTVSTVELMKVLE